MDVGWMIYAGLLSLMLGLEDGRVSITIATGGVRETDTILAINGTDTEHQARLAAARQAQLS